MLAFEPLSIATSSLAGIVTAGAGVITALALLLTSLAVVVPQLRALVVQSRAQSAHLDVQDRKLSVIHTLVNSTLTASIQAELDATLREIMLLRELENIGEAAGNSPNSERLTAMQVAEQKIAALRMSIQERLEQANSLAEGTGEGHSPWDSDVNAPAVAQ